MKVSIVRLLYKDWWTDTILICLLDDKPCDDNCQTLFNGSYAGWYDGLSSTAQGTCYKSWSASLGKIRPGRGKISKVFVSPSSTKELYTSRSAQFGYWMTNKLRVLNELDFWNPIEFVTNDWWNQVQCIQNWRMYLCQRVVGLKCTIV